MSVNASILDIKNEETCKSLVLLCQQDNSENALRFVCVHSNVENVDMVIVFDFISRGI